MIFGGSTWSAVLDRQLVGHSRVFLNGFCVFFFFSLDHEGAVFHNIHFFLGFRDTGAHNWEQIQIILTLFPISSLLN